MSAPKRVRAIECIDCAAVLTAEDDDALVDALGKHYVTEHTAVPMTEDRIRKEIAAGGTDA